MNTNVRGVLNSILDRFKNGDIPAAVAFSMFPIADIPSAKWSLLNRTLMFFAGTQDGRGYRQWQAANRYVKKGAKAFYILVPCIYKEKDGDEETEFLKGFKCSPIFRYEDTEGEELDYLQIELPPLPLITRAEEWGIAVRAIPGNYRYAGYYSSKNQEIALATKDECIFFHELAHAAHKKTKGQLKSGQDPLQEIVAELSAQALCRLVGKTNDQYLGNSYKYIETYAEKIKLSPLAACTRVMGEVEKVLHLILEPAKEG
jgi:hypothetical protein